MRIAFVWAAVLMNLIPPLEARGAPVGARGATVRARGAIISPQGRRLSAVLDSMQVEQRWLPGTAVEWRTGELDPAGKALASHCSAFVAAVCSACGVYVLRPPDHGEWLLANAQCRWLEDEGPRYGWTRLGGGLAAQRAANRGHLVLACYLNPDRDDPGHVAVVRPSARPDRAVRVDGPDLTQAGIHNFERVCARTAFELHVRPWQPGRIAYYLHRVP